MQIVVEPMHIFLCKSNTVFCCTSGSWQYFFLFYFLHLQAIKICFTNRRNVMKRRSIACNGSKKKYAIRNSILIYPIAQKSRMHRVSFDRATALNFYMFRLSLETKVVYARCRVSRSCATRPSPACDR